MQALIEEAEAEERLAKKNKQKSAFLAFAQDDSSESSEPSEKEEAPV
jgi:hypothetical protein